MIAWAIKNWRLLLVAALLLAVGVQTVRLADAQRGYAALETQVAQADAARADDAVKRAEAFRKKEQALVEAGAAQGKQDAHQIAQLRDRSARLERLLRGRPDRPTGSGHGNTSTPTAGSGSASAGGSGGGATGAELYRADGEFLAGEAADHERRVIQLESCLRQYESVRKSLNGDQS